MKVADARVPHHRDVVEPEHGDIARRRAIPSLTGLRFVAALMVVVSHFPEVVPIAGAAELLDHQGAAGVTVFFVLSGFVLTYNYFDRFSRGIVGAGSYLRARVARIYPMHVVALLLVTPLIIGLTADRPSFGSWIVNLLMLQALIPAKAMHLWNIPSWSVSSELIFYCVFPFFVCWVLAKVRRPRRLLALAAALFAIEIALFCTVALIAERRLQQAGTSPEDISSMIKRLVFFPGLRVWEFFLGCVMGLALLQRRDGDRAWWRVFDRRQVRDGLVLGAGLGFLVILVLPELVTIPTEGLVAHIATPGRYLLYTPLAVAAVTALAWGPTAVSRTLEHPLAQRLGHASYSLYLLQWSLLMIIGRSTWAPSSPTWWFSGMCVLLLIAASLVTARRIEEPARRWIGRGSWQGDHRATPRALSDARD
jgi:peptidoglycan/LPS O-acetylase OafA/YrhL